MKKQFALISLGCLAGMALQLPAFSDEEVWFTKYAVGNPPAWTVDSYINAEEAYELTHPEVVKMTTTQVRKRFETYDVDHNGNLTIEEVKTIHPWP